ncbi:DUF4040 domain-containing protein [Fusibacter paucivorans]|uniref:DUF4040 domain-containing protein n=1 Tax=Fusibacter paucivorans TaxID=76009 RepID=A0ABS5PLQ5_9FIRM|nr:DUF4040 domain-containing protein [Fusibacter paucivorans]MBS7526100.1 DUF4040 domain-containing protein [Fusibacter paucivorans]
MLNLTLLALVVFSLFAVQTQKLRHAVIYLGAFSMSIAFVYLLYDAPDVALAEAIIGSSLSTILYLVALQKYKIFTIYICVNDKEIEDAHFFSGEKTLERQLSKFCAREELEPQIIYTVEDVHKLFEHPYAIIVTFDKQYITLYAHPENYKMQAMEQFLLNEKPADTPYRFIQMED